MKRAGLVAVTTITAAAGMFLAAQALSRFYSYHNETFDLALYAREAWGLAHGDLWNPVLSRHFFAGHVSFVLLPLGLLGKALGTVPALLVAQAAAFAATAGLLARFAARRGGDLMAVLACLLFLLYPNTTHVSAYEFHPGNLALPGIALAIDGIDRWKVRRLVGACVYILSCRADFALATSVLALLAYHRGGALRRPAIRLFFGSLTYLVTTLALRAALTRAGSTTSEDLHFGPWGGSPIGFAWAWLHAPERWLAHVLAPERLLYVFTILGPVALLPVLAPRYALIGLPFVALNLISVFPTSLKLYSHYLTPAVVGLVAATMEALGRRASRWRWGLGCAALLACIVGSWHAGGAPWSRDYPRAAFRRDAHSWFSMLLHQEIPPHASVQAPDALLPHLAERSRVHRAPPPERGTEFVVLDTRHRLRFDGQETLLRTTEEPRVRAWLARTDHQVVAAVPEGLLLRRSEQPRGRFSERFRSRMRAGEAHRLSACLAIHSATLAGQVLTLHLQARGPCPADLAFRIGGEPRSDYVRLPFEGQLSPVHLVAGEWLRSSHPVPPALARSLQSRGLHVGVLRQSGARPQPDDPVSVRVPLTVAQAAPEAPRGRGSVTPARPVR